MQFNSQLTSLKQKLVLINHLNQVNELLVYRLSVIRLCYKSLLILSQSVHFLSNLKPFFCMECIE